MKGLLLAERRIKIEGVVERVGVDEVDLIQIDRAGRVGCGHEMLQGL